VAATVKAPPLGGLVQYTGAAFADASLGALSGQTCAQTAGSQCRGFVEVTRDGGRTWTPVGECGYTASGVAIAADGRVWAWLQPAACALDRPCVSRLVTGVPGQAGLRTVLTTTALPAGIVARPRARALVALDACAGRLPGGIQGCAGRLVRTANAGTTWTTVWHAERWVGAPALAGGHVWAVGAVGDASGRVTAFALRAATTAGPFRAVGTIADVPYAGGAGAGFHASVAVSGNTVFAALSDVPSCAMHGCSLSGLYASGDAGATWYATPWPAATGGCAMPDPLVIAWQGRFLAKMTHNLAACWTPATAFVAGVADRLRVASSLPNASVVALGVRGSAGVWALTSQALLTSGNLGATWLVRTPALSPTEAVAFASATRGLGIGSAMRGGAVEATRDGGHTWVPVGEVPLWDVSALDMVSARVAFAAGGRGPGGMEHEIWRTDDGGRTWTRLAVLSRARSVVALRLAPDGAGLAVVEPLHGSPRTVVQLLGEGASHATVLASTPGLAQTAAVEPDGQVYVGMSWGGPTRLEIWTGHAWATQARVGADTIAQVSPIGRGVTAALSVPYPPSGGRAWGGAWRTVVVAHVGGTWRAWALPEAAGAPVGLFVRDARRGWLLTGSPSAGTAGVLWQTTDGGRRWTAIAG